MFNLTSPDLSLIDRTLTIFRAGWVTDGRVILNLVQLMDNEPPEYSTSYITGLGLDSPSTKYGLLGNSAPSPFDEPSFGSVSYKPR